MSARLVPLNDSGGPPVSLQRPVVLIGRHPECDVRIELPQISRRHCCVALAYDRLTIRDLGSRNGIRVNGERVDEARLMPGDELAIAQLVYRLEDLGAAKPAALAAIPPPLDLVSPTPSDFPDLTSDSNDPDGDLIPLDDMYPSL